MISLIKTRCGFDSLISLHFLASLFFLMVLSGCNQKTPVAGGEEGKLSEGFNVNCNDAVLPDYSQLSVLDTPDKISAIARARDYLTYVSCQKTFPEPPFFNAYFFTPDMLGEKYTAVEYNAGFNKQPGSLKVETGTGLSLLFCFNKMVINCGQVKDCDCPYDFNYLPQKKGG